MKKSLFAVLTVLVAALFAVFGTAAASAEPAAAQPVAQSMVSFAAALATDCTIVSESTDGGAAACWNPTGEHLYNCDLASDSRHPELYYYRSTSPNTQRHISDAPTAGYCVDHNLADIPESGWIDVLACNYDGGTLKSCDSSYRYAYAQG